MVRALIGILFLSQACFAESFFRHGPSIPSSDSSVMSSIGFRDNLIGSVIYQYEAGAWLGPKSSFFSNASLGIEIKVSYLVLRSVHGLAFVSAPDSQINSYFPNLNHDLYMGLRDSSGSSVGVNYKHVSATPGTGRSFISIDLGIAW